MIESSEMGAPANAQGGAPGTGLSRLEPTVREENENALALYTNLGFVTEGILRNSIKLDGKYESQLMMALLFESQPLTAICRTPPPARSG